MINFEFCYTPTPSSVHLKKLQALNGWTKNWKEKDAITKTSFDCRFLKRSNHIWPYFKTRVPKDIKHFTHIFLVRREAAFEMLSSFSIFTFDWRPLLAKSTIRIYLLHSLYVMQPFWKICSIFLFHDSYTHSQKNTKLKRILNSIVEMTHAKGGNEPINIYRIWLRYQIICYLKKMPLKVTWAEVRSRRSVERLCEIKLN